MNKHLPDDCGKPFLDHLEEFRHTLFACVIVFIIAFTISIPLVPYIINAFTEPLAASNITNTNLLQSIEVTGAFRLTVRTAVLTGLTMASPFILFFIGRFVFPGLTPKERKAAARALAGSLVLFVLGVFIAYKSTLMLAIKVMLKLHNWLHIAPHWTINSYMAFCLNLLLAFGLAFQLPVIILLLGNLGILSAARLRERRPHVIVILLILAMILTPPDILTQLMLALPLILLYELCIWILYFTQRRKP